MKVKKSSISDLEREMKRWYAIRDALYEMRVRFNLTEMTSCIYLATYKGLELGYEE